MPDIEKVIKTCEECIEKGSPAMSYHFYYDVIELLKEQPQIVRCKDCWKKGNPYECRLDSDLEEHGGHRTEEYDDWFCADGERRTE